MQVPASDETPEPAARQIARHWVDPTAAGPARATIKQLATALGLDTDTVRAGLRELVQDGIADVRRRPCCAPNSDLCHPDTLQDNEHFELAPGWSHRRETSAAHPDTPHRQHQP